MLKEKGYSLRDAQELLRNIRLQRLNYRDFPPHNEREKEKREEKKREGSKDVRVQGSSCVCDKREEAFLFPESSASTTLWQFYDELSERSKFLLLFHVLNEKLFKLTLFQLLSMIRARPNRIMQTSFLCLSDHIESIYEASMSRWIDEKNESCNVNNGGKAFSVCSGDRMIEHDPCFTWNPLQSQYLLNNIKIPSSCGSADKFPTNSDNLQIIPSSAVCSGENTLGNSIHELLQEEMRSIRVCDASQSTMNDNIAALANLKLSNGIRNNLFLKHFNSQAASTIPHPDITAFSLSGFIAGQIFRGVRYFYNQHLTKVARDTLSTLLHQVPLSSGAPVFSLSSPEAERCFSQLHVSASTELNSNDVASLVLSSRFMNKYWDNFMREEKLKIMKALHLLEPVDSSAGHQKTSKSKSKKAPVGKRSVSNAFTEITPLVQEDFRKFAETINKSGLEEERVPLLASQADISNDWWDIEEGTRDEASLSRFEERVKENGRKNSFEIWCLSEPNVGSILCEYVSTCPLEKIFSPMEWSSWFIHAFQHLETEWMESEGEAMIAACGESGPGVTPEANGSSAAGKKQSKGKKKKRSSNKKNVNCSEKEATEVGDVTRGSLKTSSTVERKEEVVANTVAGGGWGSRSGEEKNEGSGGGVTELSVCDVSRRHLHLAGEDIESSWRQEGCGEEGARGHHSGPKEMDNVNNGIEVMAEMVSSGGLIDEDCSRGDIDLDLSQESRLGSDEKAKEYVHNHCGGDEKEEVEDIRSQPFQPNDGSLSTVSGDDSDADRSGPRQNRYSKRDAATEKLGGDCHSIPVTEVESQEQDSKLQGALCSAPDVSLVNEDIPLGLSSECFDDENSAQERLSGERRVLSNTSSATDSETQQSVSSSASERSSRGNDSVHISSTNCRIPQVLTDLLTRDIRDMALGLRSLAERRRPWQLATIDMVKQVVRGIWMHAEVDVFGSFSTGLSIPCSDIDLIISGVNLHQAQLVGGKWLSVMSLLSQQLQLAPWVTTVHCIENTAMPVIKVTTAPVPMTGPALATGEGGFRGVIKLDISFSTVGMVAGSHHGAELSGSQLMHQGIATRDFVMKLCAMNTALVPLTLVLKQFLSENGLHDPYTGGLTSYALTIMVASILQPYALQPPHTHPDLGSLLLIFFKKFGTGFDTRKYAVALAVNGPFVPLTGDLIPRVGSKGYWNPPAPVVVIDPLNPQNNLGRSCFGFRQLQATFDAALEAALAFLNSDREMHLPQGSSVLGVVFGADHHRSVLNLASRVWCPVEINDATKRDIGQSNASKQCPPSLAEECCNLLSQMSSTQLEDAHISLLEILRKKTDS